MPSSGTTSKPARKSKSPGDPRATPAMRQYYAFKEKHPECVLFFRMGDFYEMFDEDARTAHKALGITLTERTKGVPMAGVPYHAVEGYLRRMIEQGYRVAVCEQVQDPAEARGVVDRAVTRVLTPGTLVDETLLEDGAANTLAAVLFLEEGDDSCAVAAVAELSTGAFTLVDLPAGRVADELARHGPAELLYCEPADGAVPPRVKQLKDKLGVSLTPRPSWTFRPGDAIDLVLAHYRVAALDGFGLHEDDPGISPAGALLRYLQETQAAEGEASRSLGHLQPPKRLLADRFVAIDHTSLRALEIERTMRSGQLEGSLLWVFMRCVTPMGKRLLREWLCFPLRDLAAIESRQRCVGAILDDEAFADDLSARLCDVQDVARMSARMAMGRATPRDLVGLGRSVHQIGALHELLDQRPAFAPCHERLEGLIESLRPLSATILQRCVDAPPGHLRDGGLFKDGFDAELDEARGLQKDANTWLAAYQKRLIEQTAIPSLKVGYNKVFGYYIEITHAHVNKVPDAFTRKQTLKNAERYITPELKEFEDKVTTAETRAIEREKALFDQFCRRAAGLVRELSSYAQIVAELDVLACFADVARHHRYVRPTMVAQPVLEIEQGRHPVLDVTLGDRFVPNDTEVGGAALRAAAESDSGSRDRTTGESDGSSENCTTGHKSLALITGPNMAGKSTYIRQVALITLLAHTGSFVPAASATIGLTDRIFTRIGAHDELHAGQSTFMVEMIEAANILHHATERSLVILDEIGRGTSTLDGLSLAWAIAETLSARDCRTLFATHYHELTALAERLANVANLHVEVREWGEEIIFLYRILPGRTDRSYGIHVARLAGLPAAAVDRANELLETLAVQTEPHDPPTHRAATAQSQMSLFTEYLDHPVVEELRSLKLDVLTPLEAFDRLRALQQHACTGPTRS